jgi:rubrerythrin
MSVSLIAAENEAVVNNLLIAFESESNAHAKYSAYAVQADAEGFRETASLFRAIARSEEIHANNHARVIRQLGGDPEAHNQAVEVQSTLENLKSALHDEIYEIDSMYPRFLVETRASDNSTARTLTWALEAEKTHATLFKEAIHRMEARGADSLNDSAREFYVRGTCGYLSKTLDPERCWVCNRFCGTFETVR